MEDWRFQQQQPGKGPARTLSRQLILTYAEINNKYYAQNSAAKKQKLDMFSHYSTSSSTTAEPLMSNIDTVGLGDMSTLRQGAHSLFGYDQSMSNLNGINFGTSFNLNDNLGISGSVNSLCPTGSISLASLGMTNSLDNGLLQPPTLPAAPAAGINNMNLGLGSDFNSASYGLQNSNKCVVDSQDSADNNNEPDYHVHVGEIICNKYVVKSKIGRGSFGQVVSAIDCSTNAPVAIKIIKNRKPFFVQAKTEIELLQELNANDRRDEYGIVTLFDTFIHKGHQCLVFELLSFNLYDLLKKTNFQGVSLNLVKKIGRQILYSLCYLKRLNIIHCDLKPENILLRDQKRSTIKIIDFGSSCKTHKRMYPYIQSRFYRAPEVLLGQGYSTEIDIWSLGCILMELHTGEPLFSGSNEFEQMLKIVCVNGAPPSHLLEYSQKASHFFIRQRNGGWKFDLSKSNVAPDTNKFSRSLEQILGLNMNLSPHEDSKVYHRRGGTDGHSFEDYVEFIDLIRRMLEYDPKSRIEPAEALRHSFFSPKQQMQTPMGNYVMEQGPLLRRTGSAPSMNMLLG